MRRMILALCLLLILPGTVVLAQDSPDNPDEDPVVHVVMFHLPTCPHCHTVIDEVLPVLEAEYGSSLEVLLLDAGVGNNGNLFFQTCTAVAMPRERCGSVPLMVIGSDWMLGSAEIPQRAPGLIADGITAGGVALPDVAGLAEAYDLTVNGSGMPGVTFYGDLPGTETQAPSANAIDQAQPGPTFAESPLEWLLALLLNLFGR